MRHRHTAQLRQRRFQPVIVFLIAAGGRTPHPIYCTTIMARPSSAIQRAGWPGPACAFLGGVDQQDTDAYRMARNASPTISCSTLSLSGGACRPYLPARIYLPFKNSMGRGDAASGPVKPVFANLLISVDLPSSAASTMVMRIGSAVISSCQTSTGLPSSSSGAPPRHRRCHHLLPADVQHIDPHCSARTNTAQVDGPS